MKNFSPFCITFIFFWWKFRCFLLETKISGTSSAILIEYHIYATLTVSCLFLFETLREIYFVVFQAPRTMNPLWPGGTSPADPAPPTPPPALRPLRTTTPVPTSPNPLRRFYQRFGDEEGVQADQVFHKKTRADFVQRPADGSCPS